VWWALPHIKLVLIFVLELVNIIVMSYRVTIERTANKTLARFDHPTRNTIEKQITELAETPRPHGVKKLTNINAYRIRTGNYRIVYTINDATQTVNITNIGHRRDIYQEL